MKRNAQRRALQSIASLLVALVSVACGGGARLVDTPVTSVAVALEQASLCPGEMTTVTAKPSTDHGVVSRPVTWTSSNSAVATVSGTGASALVARVTEGSATISATSEGVTGNAPLTPSASVTCVRFINALPDTSALEFLVTTAAGRDTTLFSARSFRSISSFLAVDPGSRHVRVSTSPAGLGLRDTILTLDAGQYYTAVEVGYARSGTTVPRRFILRTESATVPAGNLAVAFANMSGGAQDVRVTLNCADVLQVPTFANVPPISFSSFVLSVAQPLCFSVRAAGGGATNTFLAVPTDLLGSGNLVTGFFFPVSIPGSPAQPFVTPGLVYAKGR